MLEIPMGPRSQTLCHCLSQVSASVLGALHLVAVPRKGLPDERLDTLVAVPLGAPEVMARLLWMDGVVVNAESACGDSDEKWEASCICAAKYKDGSR